MATTSSLQELSGIMIHLEEGASKEMGSEMMVTPSVWMEEVSKEEEVIHKIIPSTTPETQGMDQTIVKSSVAMAMAMAMGAEVIRVASTGMARAILPDIIQTIEDRTMMLEDRIMKMTTRMEECQTWSSNTC